MSNAIDGETALKGKKVLAYTLAGCVHCLHLHELLERCSIPDDRITFVDVGSDISKEDFAKLFPDAAGYPHVVVDGKSIGGLVETAKWMIKKGYVSSNKHG